MDNDSEVMFEPWQDLWYTYQQRQLKITFDEFIQQYRPIKQDEEGIYFIDEF